MCANSHMHLGFSCSTFGYFLCVSALFCLLESGTQALQCKEKAFERKLALHWSLMLPTCFAYFLNWKCSKSCSKWTKSCSELWKILWCTASLHQVKVKVKEERLSWANLRCARDLFCVDLHGLTCQPHNVGREEGFLIFLPCIMGYINHRVPHLLSKEYHCI